MPEVLEQNPSTSAGEVSPSIITSINQPEVDLGALPKHFSSDTTGWAPSMAGADHLNLADLNNLPLNPAAQVGEATVDAKLSQLEPTGQELPENKNNFDLASAQLPGFQDPSLPGFSPTARSGSLDIASQYDGIPGVSAETSFPKGEASASSLPTPEVVTTRAENFESGALPGNFAEQPFEQALPAAASAIENLQTRLESNESEQSAQQVSGFKARLSNLLQRVQEGYAAISNNVESGRYGRAALEAVQTAVNLLYEMTRSSEDVRASIKEKYKNKSVVTETRPAAETKAAETKAAEAEIVEVATKEKPLVDVELPTAPAAEVVPTNTEKNEEPQKNPEERSPISPEQIQNIIGFINEEKSFFANASEYQQNYTDEVFQIVLEKKYGIEAADILSEVMANGEAGLKFLQTLAEDETLSAQDKALFLEAYLEQSYQAEIDLKEETENESNAPETAAQTTKATVAVEPNSVQPAPSTESQTRPLETGRPRLELEGLLRAYKGESTSEQPLELQNDYYQNALGTLRKWYRNEGKVADHLEVEPPLNLDKTVVAEAYFEFKGGNSPETIQAAMLDLQLKQEVINTMRAQEVLANADPAVDVLTNTQVALQKYYQETGHTTVEVRLERGFSGELKKYDPALHSLAISYQDNVLTIKVAPRVPPLPGGDSRQHFQSILTPSHEN